MSKIKVSIVEDEDEIRNGLEFFLKRSDEFECLSTFTTAEDAIERIHENLPDVIIMDIGLPGMSGILGTKEIKSKFPKIQIMICTIHEDDDRLFNALSAGATGYILKRTPPAVMLEAIKDLYHGGSPMSPQIGRKVVESLRGSRTTGAMKSDQYNLSKREVEILELLSAGFRNKEIADKLVISAHTVRSHIYNIYEKLHVRSRVEALNKINS